MFTFSVIFGTFNLCVLLVATIGTDGRKVRN